MKYYFLSLHDEMCYPAHVIREQAKEMGGGLPITVYEATPEYGNGFYFCKKLNEAGIAGEDSCGKLCPHYAPRNGKNGRCKFSSHTYIHGKMVELK